MDDYISRAEAVALAMQYCPDDDGVCSQAGHDLRELLDDLENAPPADVRPVVLCRDCKFWKDQHIRMNDGRDRQYGVDEKTVTNDIGINVGAMCCYEDGRGWGGADKRVFRNGNDFCSRGDARPVSYEEWWGIVDGIYPPEWHGVDM